MKVTHEQVSSWLFYYFSSCWLSNIVMMQMDVFNTFIELLRQTGNVTKGQNDMNELRQVNSYGLLVPNSCINFFWFCVITIMINDKGSGVWGSHIAWE